MKIEFKTKQFRKLKIGVKKKLLYYSFPSGCNPNLNLEDEIVINERCLN